MKTAYHIVMHLLGLGCIAVCLAIVGSKGDLDLHWSGWIAVAFFVLMSVGIVCGWFPWRGRPLRVLVKGFYVMSALALIGFGFTIDDPIRPQMWMVLVGLGVAIIARIAIRVVMRVWGGEDEDGSEVALPKAVNTDPMF
jgi:MFS family permease